VTLDAPLGQTLTELVARLSVARTGQQP